MDYFPLTIALGKAFCNRKSETKHLKVNIQKSRPTLIVSPRRYGKTSLALNTIRQLKLNYVHFDFLSVTDEDDIESIILQGVGKLILQLEKGVKKALRVATDFFSGLDIKLAIDRLGLTVEISQKKRKPVYNILSVLERIEKLSTTYNKKIVLFFDEFQRVNQVSEGASIEAVMRQVAQISKNLTFIFSGSNRHLLYRMFGDRNKPFYKLCDRITLERISSEEYYKHIQKAALDKWSQELNEFIINRIFELTEYHPYYINVLCSRLWEEVLPTLSVVDYEWYGYIEEERSQVAIEMDLLSNSQRKLLIILARHDGTDTPRSGTFQNLARMSGSTITQALKFLERKDYVYKNQDGYYKVLDPMIKVVLSGR